MRYTNGELRLIIRYLACYKLKSAKKLSHVKNVKPIVLNVNNDLDAEISKVDFVNQPDHLHLAHAIHQKKTSS